MRRRMGSRTSIMKGLRRYRTAMSFRSNTCSSAFACSDQFFVSLRFRRARSMRRVFSNVSGMMKSPIVLKKHAMIRVIYSVQRQPRYDMVMKPPTIGPATGPMNVLAANIDIAIPRSTGPNRSARIPDT